jgi:hypothetical protein
MEIIKIIQNRIYEIRGERVMLDNDLAELYETKTRTLNQAVKRNSKRFPKDFMFQLSKEEFEDLRFQIETSKDPEILRSQIVTSSWGGRSFLPYVFTEQGIAMLSGVLNSEMAINMNIAIMRAFVEVRRAIVLDNDIRNQLKTIKERLGIHDSQLNQLYEALENLMDENAAKRNWKNRERIGFKE